MDSEKSPEKTLRQMAEERLRRRMTGAGPLSPEEAGRLAHELQVHQIELELQNEELRQTAEQLESSRRQFFDLFNHAPLGYLALDEVGIVRLANETFCRMVGKESAALVGRPLAEQMDDAGRELFLGRYRAFFKDPSAKSMEVRLCRAGGGFFDAHLEGLPFHTEGAQPRLLLMASDISERKRMEEALRQGEERFRALFEGAAVGISDAGGVVARVSQRLCDLLGYECSEMIGLRSEDLTHPEDRPLHRQMVEKMKAGELDSYTVEKRYLRKDGGVVWVNLTVIAVRDSWGALTQRVGITQDITARKQAEQALEEERQRFRDLFEHTPAAIWLEDLSAVMEWMQQLKSQGVDDLRAYLAQRPDQAAHAFSLIRVVDVNQAAVEMNAARSKQHLVENLAQTVTEATLQALTEELAALWEGKLHFEVEIQSRRLDGRPLFSISRFDIPLLDAGTDAAALPDYRRMVFTAVDITALKNAEQKLIAQEKLAGIGTLAAGMAHEINSPLQIVTGVAESLKKLADGGGRLDRGYLSRRLELLNRSAWRIAHIVRALAEYAAGAEGEMGWHALNEIVRGAMSLLEPAFKSWRDTPVEVELGADLPLVFCERSQITRILISLIQNAREAMPGGGRITVSASYDEAAQCVNLRVADTGGGVAEDIRSRIFDPFFTTKPVGSGAGLGLSIAASIARAHGGALELESTGSTGSVFKLSLPLSPREQPAKRGKTNSLGRYL